MAEDAMSMQSTRDETGEMVGGAPGAIDPDALVTEHLYLVQHVVNQLASRYPRHVDRGDLWSAGAHGLVEASRRYDPSTGVPFARFAQIRIRGAMVDSTRNRDWASRGLRRGLRALNDCAAKFEEEHGRQPAAVELADALGIEVGELERRRTAALRSTLLHLDQPIAGHDAEETTLGEMVADTSDDGDPAAALAHKELLGTVRTAVQFLPAVQREVVERCYFQGHLLRDVADTFGVTEARVSQLRTEALHAIRAYLSTTDDVVPAVPTHAPGVRRRAAYVAEVTAMTNWRSRLDAAPVGHAVRQSA
jgi:RNA polymerase sigma factor for flagellar operon FliA